MAAGVFVLAARFLPLREWITHFQAWIAGLGTAGAILFAAAYVAGAILLAPVWLLTVVAGLTYPLWAAFALVSIVSTISAGLAFWISRRFLRGRVEDLALRNPRLSAIDRAVAREGWKVVFLLRLSPLLPYGLSNYVYGVTAVAFWPYLLASWIGMMPVTFLYVSLGAAGRAAVGGSAGRTPAEWALLGAGLAATIAVTVWIGRTAKKELASSRFDPLAPTGTDGIR